jgi:hypothetical protein
VSNSPLYPNAKPIDGDVLILCEADVVGSETELLKLWADSADLAGRFVKVMACGTAEALYGVADAIGRTIPIIVVEDRDFRTADEASKDCTKKLKNREGRNIAMLGWFAWQRAEIENYFTDDDVLPPVFADAFECSEDDVRAGILSALEHLPVSQALEYALYRARKSWQSTDANRALRVECWKWDETGEVALTSELVRGKLKSRLEKWQNSLHDGNGWEDPWAGKQLLADFDAKCQGWSGLAYDDVTWRQDWACKEVVKRVRMLLAQAKPGWWSTPTDKNAPVDWRAMSDDKTRDAHDRLLERSLQPKLVQAVAGRLATDGAAELRADLNKLATLIRSV